LRLLQRVTVSEGAIRRVPWIVPINTMMDAQTENDSFGILVDVSNMSLCGAENLAADYATSLRILAKWLSSV
jgi:hypothetical protein